MPVLRDDLDLERGGRRRANRSGWGLFALVFLAISLLVLSRLEHPVVRDLRTSVTELLAPVLSTLARWSEPIATRIGASSDARRLISENEHLRERVARLEGWEARARELQRRLDDLAPMVRMVPEAGYTFLTMRVVGEPRGPFSRTALVGAGTAQGLRKGYAVVDGGGVSLGGHHRRCAARGDRNRRRHQRTHQNRRQRRRPSCPVKIVGKGHPQVGRQQPVPTHLRPRWRNRPTHSPRRPQRRNPSAP